MAEQKSGKIFSLKHLPMDMGRLVCLLAPLVLRVKKVTTQLKPYRQKLEGAAIVAANHTSFADPFIVGVTFWYRRIYFLVAEVVMKGKLRSLLLKGMGCIKIERDIADIQAVKKSIGVLKDGRILTVFPQGVISQEESIEKIKSGAVFMAFQANVPILPMYIGKRPHWYSCRKVVIGDMIYPKTASGKKIPSTGDINEFTNRLAEEVNRCKAALEG